MADCRGQTVSFAIDDPVVPVAEFVKERMQIEWPFAVGQAPAGLARFSRPFSGGIPATIAIRHLPAGEGIECFSGEGFRRIYDLPIVTIFYVLDREQFFPPHNDWGLF